MLLPRPLRRPVNVVKIDEKGKRNLVIVSKLKNYKAKEMTEDLERAEQGLKTINREITRIYVACKEPKVRYFWRNRTFFGRECKVRECNITDYNFDSMECEREKKIPLFKTLMWNDHVKFNELRPEDRRILSSLQKSL